VGTLAPSGNLEPLALPRLLLAMRRERFTGTLALARASGELRIRVCEGLPVLAEREAPEVGLARRLAAAGRLDPDAVEGVEAHAREHRVTEAAALLRLRLLPPRDVLAALRAETRDRILEACGDSEGRYHLEPAEAPPSDAAPLRLDPVALAVEALERHASAESLLAALASRLERHPAARPGLRAIRDRFAGDGAALALLDACDGRAPLRALVEQADAPGALAAAWLADAAELVEWREAPLTDEKPAPARETFEIVFEAIAPEPPREPTRPRAVAAEAGAAALGARAAALRDELLAHHARLAELDHYALLGVARDADVAAIRRAYTLAAKRFHPDALASQGLAELRDVASTVFARIARAWATLSDPESRRRYDAEPSASDDADAERLATAEGMYRKAEIMLRMGDFQGAIRFLRPAVQLVPDDPAYRAGLGWALHKKNPPESAAARDHLRRAVELAPGDATARFRLGVVLRALGEHEAAHAQLERARRIDPAIARE
jgi:tetratricopeptide (TPR) repeat protein